MTAETFLLGVLMMREDDLPTVDGRFTLALVSDLVEVLARHGYPAPTGRILIELCWGPPGTTRPTLRSDLTGQY